MSELRRQLLRSLAESGVRPRLVSSNRESAVDRIIRMGAVAKALNEESKLDPEGDAA